MNTENLEAYSKRQGGWFATNRVYAKEKLFLGPIMALKRMKAGPKKFDLHDYMLMWTLLESP